MDGLVNQAYCMHVSLAVKSLLDYVRIYHFIWNDTNEPDVGRRSIGRQETLVTAHETSIKSHTRRSLNHAVRGALNDWEVVISISC